MFTRFPTSPGINILPVFFLLVSARIINHNTNLNHISIFHLERLTEMFPIKINNRNEFPKLRRK